LFRPSENWRPLRGEDRILVQLAHGRLDSKLNSVENASFEFIEKF